MKINSLPVMRCSIPGSDPCGLEAGTNNNTHLTRVLLTTMINVSFLPSQSI